jgi:hypothetical protein
VQLGLQQCSTLGMDLGLELCSLALARNLSRLQCYQLAHVSQLHSNPLHPPLSTKSNLLNSCDNAVEIEYQSKLHKSFAAAKL